MRAWEATGRADARLVAAAREVIDAETSTGTRSRLIRRVTKAVEATYGPGVVPMPARTTFYRLIDALAAGRHTFGSAVTRRQTANRPQGMFAPTHAARPGEQVQVGGYHADLPLVTTPTIRKVISTSRLLVQLNRNQVSARRGVIISGASGTGKTTALTQLGRTHELHTRKRYPADRHRLPVLHGATGGDGTDARCGVRPLPGPGVHRPGQHHRHRQRGLRHRRPHPCGTGLRR